MRNNVSIVAGAAIVAVLASGCFKKSVTAPVCTQIAVPALQITVVDSLTNQPTLFQNLWARARDNTYYDSVAVNLGDVQKGNVSIALAYERAGVYNVTVHADGYQLWTKNAVVVSGDACHPTTVPLTARLAH